MSASNGVSFANGRGPRAGLRVRHFHARHVGEEALAHANALAARRGDVHVRRQREDIGLAQAMLEPLRVGEVLGAPDRVSLRALPARHAAPPGHSEGLHRLVVPRIGRGDVDPHGD